jgi:RHS repeat-associated protein
MHRFIGAAQRPAFGLLPERLRAAAYHIAAALVLLTGFLFATPDVASASGTISGTVLYCEDNAGANTARVRVKYPDGTFHSYYANSSGQYTTGTLANGSYEVVCIHVGYQIDVGYPSVVINNNNPVANFKVQSCTISGSVRDGCNDAPSTGVSVHLSGQKDTTVVTAFPSGIYQAKHLPKGHYFLNITPLSGYSLWPGEEGANYTDLGTIAGCAISAPHNRRLAAYHTISGGVRTSNDASPVAGVTVTISGPTSAVVTTNASGIYTSPPLAQGSYTITPTKAGRTFTGGKTPVLGCADLTGENMIMHNTDISGGIRDACQEPLSVPVPNVPVSLSGPVNQVVYSNASGIYTFEDLPNGAYVVHSDGVPGSWTVDVDKNLTASGTNLSDQNGRAFAYKTISGGVRTTNDDSPVAGVTVTFSGPTPTAVTTNASGVYTSPPLAQGAYVVTPSKSGRTFTGGKSLTLGCSDLTGQNMIMHNTDISGGIRDACQEPLSVPVPNIPVTLSGPVNQVVYSNASGIYTFEDLPNGPYVVHSDGVADSWTVNVDKNLTASGTNLTGQNGRAFAYMTISGYSTSLETGAPIVGDRISYGELCGPVSGYVLSRENGFFETPPIPQGSYSLGAGSCADYAYLCTNPFVLDCSGQGADFQQKGMVDISELSASPGDDGRSIRINWGGGNAHTTAYRLYRSESAEGPYDLIGERVPPHVETGLACGYWAYYAVTPVNACEREGPLSAPTLGVNSKCMLPPTAFFPANGDSTALPQTFGWDAIAGATSYEVQVSADMGFTSNVWSGTSDLSSLPIALAAAPTIGAQYFWRVKSAGAFPSHDWSEVQWFITESPPLPLPEQILGLEFPAGDGGEGVITALGAVTRSFPILTLRGPGGEVSLDATYSSVALDGSSLGPKWSWTLGQRLDTASPPFAVANLEDGQDVRFRWTGTAYATDLGVYDSLMTVDGGGYELIRPDRERLSFDGSGKLAAIRDRNGNAITLTYSGTDLSQFTDQGGRTFTVTNSAGKVSQITDVLGRQWHFEYGLDGHLSAFIDASEARTEYSYDGSGRLILVKDARGNNALQCTYGGDGRVATQTDAAGGLTTFGYDDPERRTTINHPLVGSTVHVKDVNSRLLFEINPRGDSTTYTYDANHNRVAVRDGRGFVTQYEYDTRGNVVRKIDPLGATTRTIYDLNNRPIEETNALGHVTSWTNDPNGNPTRIDEPLGRVTLNVYNPAGQVLTTTDANNHPTTHIYDAQGNRTSTTNGEGDLTQFGYDAVGRRTSVTDGLGHETTFEHDRSDRLLRTINALPATTSSEYDLNGNRIATIDARGKRTEHVYDEKNRLVSTRDPLENTTLYFYDALDRRIRTRDPRGHEEVNEYDEVGNLTRTTTALGFQTLHAYDANRNRTSTTDPRGKTTTYLYDGANRLISTTSPLGHVTASVYDPLGRETARTNPREKTTVFGYDALGRLVSVQAPGGATITYSYDLVGNRIGRSNANGHPTAYAYDDANRMTSMEDALGAAETYVYDAAGNRVQRTDRNGRTTFYDYDAANRLIRDRYPDATQIERTLDLEGNLVGLADRWGTTTYGYDDAERLITATDHDDRALSFEYDATGNRVALVYPGGERARYAYDDDDRLVAVTDWGEKTTAYGYDQAGNNTAITHPNGVTTTQSFDDDSRITALLTRSAAPETLVAVSYELDENGNRTRLTRVDRRQDPIRDDVRDPYAWSAFLSQRLSPPGVDSIVVVSGELWDEALAGGGLARRRGLPLLVVPGDNLLYSPDVKGEIERLAATSPGLGAIMMGEIDGLSATVESQIRALGLGVRRAFGANRVATAALAAEPCSVAVLLGIDDAARVGPAALLAGRIGASVFYVEQDAVPAATAEALTALAIPAVILVGDVASIGNGVTTWLESHDIAIRKRFDASDASELSVAIQDYVGGSRSPPGFVRLLSNDAWQDGLPTGARIGPNGAALYVHPQDLAESPAATRWVGLHKGRPLGVLLTGSEAALSAALLNSVRTLLRTTVTEYAYNDLDELVSEVIPRVDSLYYAYDPVGNRSSITHNGVANTYAFDTNDRLVSAGDVTYGYDSNGNRTSRTQGLASTTYEYDFENRLVRVVTPAGESRYRYDGIGRRIRSEEPGRTTRYVVDPTAKPYETLEEREDGGALRTTFVHAAGLVSERAATGALRFFHYDGLGSTTALTDSVGADVGHLAFAAFGDTALDIGATDTRYGFVGRYGVEATSHGLVFMRDRFYDPETGLFLSEDPERASESQFLGVPTYLYALGNPVTNIDADGRDPYRWSSPGILPGLARGLTVKWFTSSPYRPWTAVPSAPGVIGSGAMSAAVEGYNYSGPARYRPARMVTAGVAGSGYSVAGAAVGMMVGGPVGLVVGVAAGAIIGATIGPRLAPAIRQYSDTMTNLTLGLPRDMRVIGRGAMRPLWDLGRLIRRPFRRW